MQRETEKERETVSRTCKFLSVCEAAAAVEVMQPAININDDLHAKEHWRYTHELTMHETTVYESSCAPKIRNERVQGRWSPETNRELRPHFRLHFSVKQTKGCVLETQPVSDFSSAVGLTVSFLSDTLNSTSRACPGKSKTFFGFHRKNVSPLAFPWDECSHGLHAKAAKER